MKDTISWNIKPMVYYTLRNKENEVIKESRNLNELKDYRNTFKNKNDYQLYEHLVG